MANFAQLKAAIQQAVDWDNHNNEISGLDMLGILNTMINSLGAGYMFSGVAKLTPTQTDPGTPDQNVFYIAAEPGTYTNFPISGGYLQVAENEVAIFKYNGQWSKETTGAATAAQVNQLGQETNQQYVPWTNEIKENEIIRELFVEGSLSSYAYYGIWVWYDYANNRILLMLGGNSAPSGNATTIKQVYVQLGQLEDYFLNGWGTSDITIKAIFNVEKIKSFGASTYFEWGYINMGYAQNLEYSPILYARQEDEEGKVFGGSVAPLKILNVAYDTVSASTGYSSYYGKYWETDHFANNNMANVVVYDVRGKDKVHIVGNHLGGVYVNAYFADEALTTFVANGSKIGSGTNQYFDYYENVPAGANYMIINQMYQYFGVLPLVRLVDNAEYKEKTHKVVLLGDSFTQMAGMAVGLMEPIRKEHPNFDILNYGIGGERSLDIMARTGFLQIAITPDDSIMSTDAYGIKYIELPAAANSEINIGGNSALSNSWDNAGLILRAQDTPMDLTNFRVGYINGAQVRIERISNEYHIIRRGAADAPTKIYKGSLFIPNNLPQIDNDDIFILNFGMNGGYSSIDELIEQIKTISNRVQTDKILILSSHYADLGDSLSSGLQNVKERDAKLAKYFGDRYISMHKYFLSEGVYDALASGLWNNGVYPTDIPGETHPNAADISAIENQTFAPMFRVNPNWNDDRIHLSQRSYLIYYSKVYRRLVELGYLNP